MPKYREGQVITTKLDGMRGADREKNLVKVKILKYLPKESNIAPDFKYEYYLCEYPKGVLNLFYITDDGDESADPDVGIDECLGWSSRKIKMIANKLGLKVRSYDNNLEESKMTKQQKLDKIKQVVKLIEQKTGKKVRFTEAPYIPYEGGAGPEKEQAAENTLILFKKLQKAGIPCKMDNGQYAKKIWDGDEKMIVLSKNHRNIYVSYDRWGFAADGLGSTKYEIDQEGLDYTFKTLVAWYTGKNITESKEQKVNKIKKLVIQIQEHTGRKIIFKEAENSEAQGNKIVDNLQQLSTLADRITQLIDKAQSFEARQELKKLALGLTKQINSLIEEETSHSDLENLPEEEPWTIRHPEDDLEEDVKMTMDQISKKPDMVKQLQDDQINVDLYDPNDPTTNTSSSSTISSIKTY